ncbi:retinaldehyde-binding protein 1-like [Brevipalpus obovatus]|uniref:retinaldehyde-binding protein 1-like n=1 Tax=Brevipalpus obovatus TaxID=246614 RepID=UPI003D9E4875
MSSNEDNEIVIIRNGDESKRRENDDLEKFRKIVQQHQKLGQMQFSDNFLLMFLRFKRDDPTKAFDRLKSYVKKLRQRPDIFDWNTDLEATIRSGYFDFTSGKSHDGTVIMIYRPGRFFFDQFNIINTVQHCVAFLTSYPEAHEKGVQIVVDVSEVALRKVLKFGVSGAKLTSDFLTKILPVRIQRIHILKSSWLINFGVRMFLPFMPYKLRQRIVFYSDNLDDFYQHCPLSALPPDLGGTLRTYSYEENLEIISQGKNLIEPLRLQLQNMK